MFHLCFYCNHPPHCWFPSFFWFLSTFICLNFHCWYVFDAKVYFASLCCLCCKAQTCSCVRQGSSGSNSLCRIGLHRNGMLVFVLIRLSCDYWYILSNKGPGWCSGSALLKLKVIGSSSDWMSGPYLAVCVTITPWDKHEHLRNWALVLAVA